MGSFLLLGEVVTTLPLVPAIPLLGRCGACTRCMDACPTGAFPRPFVLDARRCISYLTIEHRGSCDLRVGQRVAPWLFGCDVCQEVCPYNRARGARIAPGTPFDCLPQWTRASIRDLLALDEAAVAKLTEGSPLRRVRGLDWKRNALLAIDRDVEPETIAMVSELAHDAISPPWLRELAAFVALRAGESAALAPMRQCDR
jgi:epoxyqueuosine reductase